MAVENKESSCNMSNANQENILLQKLATISECFISTKK